MFPMLRWEVRWNESRERTCSDCSFKYLILAVGRSVSFIA